MRRIGFPGGAGVALVMLTACAGRNDASPNPTAPTSAVAAAAVVALAITSAPASPTTFQLTATARLSDGSSPDVTAASTWSTSNPSIAGVSPTGLLTVVGTGDVDARATYRNVGGSATLHVIAPLITAALSGVVQEAMPDARALTGVRVAITTAAGAAVVSTSGQGGVFTFANVTGIVSVEATQNGYQPWRVANLSMDRDRQIEIAMYPMPPKDGSGATATARCSDGTWSWARTRAQACTANGGIAYGVCPGALCEEIKN